MERKQTHSSDQQPVQERSPEELRALGGRVLESVGEPSHIANEVEARTAFRDTGATEQEKK